MRYFSILTFSVFVVIMVLIMTTTPVNAALAVVKADGSVVINVLSASDSQLEIPENDSVKIIKTVDNSALGISNVTLLKRENKMTLNVDTPSGTKNLDVTDYKDELVEIEERPEVRKIAIGVNDGHFSIAQRGIVAITDYEVEIDSEFAKVSLITPSGAKYLAILPRDAVNTTLRSKLINKIDFKNAIEIVEQDNRELSYEIKGDRVLDVFNFFDYEVPVKAAISVTTGEVLFVDQPKWLTVFDFFFV